VISLKISQITDNPRASFQCLVAQLHFRATIITTAVIYRPHSSSLFGFINEFTELCSDLNCFTNIIIVGDFNLKDVTSLDDILTMFNLIQHVSSATHDKGRLLDLVISRNDDLSVVNLNLTPGLADHHAVLFETLTQIYQLPTNNMVSRQYNKIDLDNFSIDLWNGATLLLVGIHNDICLDEFVDMWNSSVTSVLDKWSPKKVRRIRTHINVPWFNNELRKSNQLLRRAEGAWPTSKSTIYYELYKKQLTEHGNLLHSTKTGFIKERLESCGQNSRRM
jgi:hypothetical protein